MVVDDEAITAMYLQEQLHEMGYQVIGPAFTGEEALGLVRSAKPDLILMDIVLEGKYSGIETAHRIRRETDTPVIFITGHEQKSYLEKAKACHPYGYIMKPVSGVQIRGAIEIALDKRRMEQRLRESQRRYRLLAENSTDVIWSTDINMQMTYISPIIKNLLGYTEKEFSNKKLNQILSPTSFKSVMERYTAFIEKENSEQASQYPICNLEVEQIRKDGTTVWTELRILILRDKQTRPVGFHGITRDITGKKKVEREVQKAKSELEVKVKERTTNLKISNRDLKSSIKECHQCEKDLRASERKYRTLLDTMNEGFVVHDNQGMITYANKKMQAILGCSPKAMAEKSLSDFTDRKNRKKLLKMQSLQRRQTIDPYELELLRTDGTTVYTIVSPQRQLNDKGCIEGFFSTITDISNLKKSENALQQEEAHLRSLMENVLHFSIYRLVRDASQPMGLKVVFVSPSITDIMGVSDPMRFETWFANVHQDDLAQVQKANQRAFKIKKFSEIIRIYHPKKKKMRWIHVLLNGLRGAIDQKIYINGILIDVTKIKTAEEQIKEQSTHLSELNTALKVLLQRRDDDRKMMENRILSNIKIGITPHILKLKQARLNSRLKGHVDIIESSLLDLISPFIHDLSLKYLNLTYTEIQVATFIKEGKSSKEIADLMNVAKSTIDTHRNKIRKKLNLNNKKKNLRSHLLSMDSPTTLAH